MPFPFTFLNNNHAMNVRPLHYKWPEFYDHVVDVTKYSFTARANARRFVATKAFTSRWMNLVRALSSEGNGRIRYHTGIRQLLQSDITVRRFMDGDSDQLPTFYQNRIVSELGPLYRYLPEGAIMHDPHAYLKSTEANAAPETLTQLKVAAR